jgi:predicted dehydrogenase
METPTMPNPIHRRTFIQSAAAIGGMAAVKAAGAPVLGSNDRIRLGVIGVGNRGDQLIEAFLPHKDCEIVAVCDVYEPYMAAAIEKVGGKAEGYRDYRKMLDRKDIDAIVVGTPDHWHALQCIDACRAGKDVYVEKPTSLAIAEGRKMVDVAKQTDRVVQVGLQRRSAKYIQEAIERIQNGEIGKVTVAKCYCLRNEMPMGIGNTTDCAPPAELDWDMWLGPAPKVPYNPNRCLYKFRWFWDYSGGQMTNIATHYIDVIQWALGKDAPQTVYTVGGKYAIEDNRETPDTMESIWQFEGPTLVTFSQHNANSTNGNPRGWEMEFQGTEGTLGISTRGYEIVPEKVRTQDLPALSPLDRKGNSDQGRAVKLAREPLSASGSVSVAAHARNFLDCMKSRQEPVCSIETGHRSSSTTLLANVALRVGRSLQWDAAKEQVVGDEEANRLLSYEYRSPWKLA